MEAITTEDSFSKAQREVITKAMEENGECVQALAKLLNYGPQASCEGREWDNRRKVTAECGDVLALIDTLVANEIVDYREILAYKNHKLKQLPNRLQHGGLVPLCDNCKSGTHDNSQCDYFFLKGVSRPEEVRVNEGEMP